MSLVVVHVFVVLCLFMPLCIIPVKVYKKAFYILLKLSLKLSDKIYLLDIYCKSLSHLSFFCVYIILVIGGGSGFVGRELTRMLKKKGHEVTVISRQPGPGRITWV